MQSFEDAAELLSVSRELLEEIQQHYNASLREETISPKLLIKIKNFMENLRSSLDFVAHGLFEKYGDHSRSSKNIAFPYAAQDLGLEQFRARKLIDAKIPGLQISRPDIVELIESYQHFSENGFRWLPVFMALNNQNKHQRLTPQIRKESRERRITTESKGVKLGIQISGNASISMTPGASIVLGNATIPGRQHISLDRPARVSGKAAQDVVVWVSFHFTDYNIPVLPFLGASFQGINRIHCELSGM